MHIDQVMSLNKSCNGKEGYKTENKIFLTPRSIFNGYLKFPDIFKF